MFVPNRFSSHYWKPSSSFRQGFKAVDVKIEQKVFTLRLDSGGSSICWSERTRNASYLLEVDREGASWIVSKLKDFIHRPSLCPNFSRFRGNVEVLTIQRINNKRGSFLEVSKLVQSGRKQLSFCLVVKMLGAGKNFPTCYTLYWHVTFRGSLGLYPFAVLLRIEST